MFQLSVVTSRVPVAYANAPEPHSIVHDMDNTKRVSIGVSIVYRVSVVRDTHVPRAASKPRKAAPWPPMARMGQASTPAERPQPEGCQWRHLGGLGTDRSSHPKASPTCAEAACGRRCRALQVPSQEPPRPRRHGPSSLCTPSKRGCADGTHNEHKLTMRARVNMHGMRAAAA